MHGFHMYHRYSAFNMYQAVRKSNVLIRFVNTVNIFYHIITFTLFQKSFNKVVFISSKFSM